MEYIYEPKDVKSLIGITNASLQIQRTRFAPYVFGKQSEENNRWSYNLIDMIGLSCMTIMHPHMVNQRAAAIVGKIAAEDVAKSLLLFDDGTEYRKYFVSSGDHCVLTHDKSRLDTTGSGPVLIVSIPWLAAQIPQKLIARLKADLVE